MSKRKDKRELRLRGEKTGGPNKAPYGPNTLHELKERHIPSRVPIPYQRASDGMKHAVFNPLGAQK